VKCTKSFVNTYAGASSGDQIVLTSDSIENIPAGWRARETYRKLSDDEFEEIFELAGPGKSFEIYSRSRLRRVE
jgi:hypothetical protein